MSLASWKQEFYPVGASTLARKKGVTAIELIDHSILKWSGALVKNTSRHGVWYSTQRQSVQGLMGDSQYTGSLVRQSRLSFSSSTCALCQRYDVATKHDGSCRLCPLAQSRGGLKCYYGNTSTSQAYGYEVNPIVMVNALKKARVFVLKQIG